MAALQKMMGDTELTEDNIRIAMQNLTPEQKAELLSEGQELKQEIMSKKEHAEERNLFFSEFNKRSEEAGMPIDKDGTHLAKKITTFMATSSDQIPQLLLLEALAGCPFLVKVAIAEARNESSEAGASASDLAEIEAALSVLRVEGWRDGEASGRPPFVRRNLLLLHAHMYNERLNALKLSDATKRASREVVLKCKRLLDMVFSYTLQCAWIKALLAITELQGCLTNGLWGHTDDECLMSMKQKLTSVGLKMPKINIQCKAADVAPGEKVSLTVTLTRSHCHSAAEMEAYSALQKSEDLKQQQVEKELAAAGGATDVSDATSAEEAGDAREGWWLVVESIRGHNGVAAMLEGSEVTHNQLAGSPTTLSPTLDEASVSSTVEFSAPATPGEYKVIVHVRSTGMIGVDAKRKVAFMVRQSKVSSKVSTATGGAVTDQTSSPEGGGEVLFGGAYDLEAAASGDVNYAEHLKLHIDVALDSVLASKPKDPFKAIQQVLFQASLTGETPAAPAPREVTAELQAFMDEYQLHIIIESCMFKMKKRLVVGPKDGVKFLISDAGDFFTEESKKLKAAGGVMPKASMTAEELRAKDAADKKAKREKEAKAEAERDAADALNAERAAALEASGKRATGGLHKFDASEVDVHGGSGTADDFMDAFGF